MLYETGEPAPNWSPPRKTMTADQLRRARYMTADGNLSTDDQLAVAAVLGRLTLLERLLMPFASYAPIQDGRYLDIDPICAAIDTRPYWTRDGMPTVGDCRAAAHGLGSAKG